MTKPPPGQLRTVTPVMDDLIAAADQAAASCTCGAAAHRCPDCRGTGWQPGPPPRTECSSCKGIGGQRPHDWECAGLHVPLVDITPSEPAPPA